MEELKNKSIIEQVSELQKIINQAQYSISIILNKHKEKTTHEKYMDIVKQFVDGESNTLIEATKVYCRLEREYKARVPTTGDFIGGVTFFPYLPPLKKVVVDYPYNSYIKFI